MRESTGHIAFISGYEYYKVDGRLFRAGIDKPIVDGRRPGQFVTAGNGVDFALRMARLMAGQPEHVS
ncbi:MAG: hypothetical protein AB7O59_09705 [Pirellulales bacterium]